MRKVFWNNYARIDYYENIDYLLENWGETVTQNFIDTVSNTIEILKKGQFEFQRTNLDNIRRAVISRQVTLFYKVEKNSVELLRFWNNYQNPKKVKT
jgi:plasmid stabilization system protein ParE